jgi:putative membrane protein
MSLVSSLAVAAVALIHLYILVLEMFLWTRPAGRKAFGLTPEFAEQTRVLGANQGLYNGFLAAGLIYGLVQGASGQAFQVFFLLCVLVAGIFGAVTASKKILVVQAVPAAVALVLLWLAS